MQIDWNISTHTHTKTGNIFVCCSPETKMEKPVFSALLDRAKANGGRWGRQWQDVPAGFRFTDPANAETFLGVPLPRSAPTPAQQPEPKRQDKSGHRPDAAKAQKLRAGAAGLEKIIADKFRDRQENTPKRQRQASEARLDGQRYKRTRAGMLALADMWDAGTVPDALQGVTTKARAYELAAARIERSGGYYDAGTDTGQPAKDTPDFLAFWSLLTIDTQDAVDEKLRRDIAVLQFAKIPGYFPTPGAVITDMVMAADLPRTSAKVLEPSAGSGAILDHLRRFYPGLEVDCIERNITLCNILRGKGYAPTEGHFLEIDPRPEYDYVLMNPPFERQQDMHHVSQAYEWLKPTGILVAIMSGSTMHRTDRLSLAFQDWIKKLGKHATITDLPADAFKPSGTGVATIMVRIYKPKGNGKD